MSSNSYCTTSNHRTRYVEKPLYGSRTGWGLIIADLCDENGNTREAVVADCRDHAGALAWLARHQKLLKEGDNSCEPS